MNVPDFKQSLYKKRQEIFKDDFCNETGIIFFRINNKENIAGFPLKCIKRTAFLQIIGFLTLFVESIQLYAVNGKIIIEF